MSEVVRQEMVKVSAEIRSVLLIEPEGIFARGPSALAGIVGSEQAHAEVG